MWLLRKPERRAERSGFGSVRNFCVLKQGESSPIVAGVLGDFDMPFLIAILGVLGAAAFWWYRMKAMNEAARDVADV
ncbi:hypothetical protein EOD12_28805, partial [Mesorhizobium sp. M7A.T.Ca.TU.009.02.1.1]